MAKDLSEIEHEGVIKEVREDIFKVAISPVTACGSCEARSSCCLHEGPAEKIIDVVREGSAHAVGDKVVVVMAREHGYRAVVLGYVLPFMLIVLTLFLGMQVLKNEVVVGVLALGILAMYYFGIYVFRQSIKRSFVFHLKTD